jgi:hypothetical protein
MAEELNPEPPTNPSVNGITPESAPPDKTPESPESIALPPKAEPSPKHHSNRHYAHPDPTPLWKITLEFGAVALGIVLAWIYYGQLRAMIGQLGQMQQSGKQTDQMLCLIQQQLGQMKEQNTLLRQQAVGTTAAAIHITANESNIFTFQPDFGQFSILLVNKGHALAKKVRVHVLMERIRLGDGRPIPGSKSSKSKIFDVIAPGEENATRFYAPLFGVLPNDDKLLQDGKIVIAIKVSLHYNDGYDNIISESVCGYGWQGGHVNPLCEPSTLATISKAISENQARTQK